MVNIPVDKILLETDAPYLIPVPYRGQRNEPVYIIEVAKKMAKLKTASLEEIIIAMNNNAKTLFSEIL